ncbi:helix-turn-helix domain-containing protein [Fusobacterium periodonticum]|mgnify:CR=1 FL=1|jgi:prophage sa05, DNA-binding protein|uniref:Prophage Sa05, DNA-binding protein n=1 Tax=Fusobacterium periodonticum 1_1_41FAA TaxID=469621 RepID=D6LIM0_9FUSO|nr:helix-turn-helix transcriptional regulator [Fusobacterium periodonticum]EFG28246.1 DNA-binding helix-turn-helix protein [Fusobacterium periodonticum 1_1_41FAA]
MATKTQEIIAKRLKEKREDSKLTLDDVSKIIGISTVTLHKYENLGILNIPVDKIEQLANLYNTNPSYIMGWSDIDNKSGNSRMDSLDVRVYNRYLNIIRGHERLKQIREHNEFTPLEFATMLDISVDELELLENGEQDIPLNVIKGLENIFHVPKEVWLIGDGISDETRDYIEKIAENQKREKEEFIFNCMLDLLKNDGYDIDIMKQGTAQEYWRITKYELPVDIVNIKKEKLIDISVRVKNYLIDLLKAYEFGYNRILEKRFDKLKF